MPARLGEMLLKSGALNEAQLERVLKAQDVYGGRLGTNLVEMGLVEEEELARLLNEKLGVPYLEADALDSVPEELLGIIPLDMVRRYRVLPVALEGERLTVAMADPTDSRAIEEIGFVCGLVVAPRICTELRLNVALERYCGISRGMRYIPVPREERPQAVTRSYTDQSGPKLATPEHVTAKLPAETAHDTKKGTCGGKGLGVGTVAERLACASGETEVVSVLLEYLGVEFDRCAFLGLQRDPALGLRVVGIGNKRYGDGGGGIALAATEQLRKVVREKRLFIGELALESGEGRMLQAMGVDLLSPTLLVPLSVAGQVVAVLCANDLKGRLTAGVFALQRVAAMAELALEMLCLRNRIRLG